MNPPSSADLEGLAELGLRRGADMRPALLRALTDLYVQKPRHTPDEERHYTELAQRLLDSVDVSSRAAVAERLAHHLAPPPRIIARLQSDLPEVAAMLLRPRSAISRDGASAGLAHAAAPAAPAGRADLADAIGADLAHELNELFFAANAQERHLILLNLPLVAPPAALHAALPHEPRLGRRLEAAVLARNDEELTHQLARALLVSRAQARRIADDELGEPVVIAAKAHNIARDQLCRILLFARRSVAVERVHALAALYDEIRPQAVHDMLAVWQALEAGHQRAGAGPQHEVPERRQAEARAFAQRTIAAWHDSTREAS